MTDEELVEQTSTDEPQNTGEPNDTEEPTSTEEQSTTEEPTTTDELSPAATQLEQLLKAHNITNYTTDQLETYIKQAMMLAEINSIAPTEKEYKRHYHDEVFLTSYYPITNPEQMVIQINGEDITPDFVLDTEGIIYFDKMYTGTLYVEYEHGILEEDITNLLVPLAFNLFVDSNGGNLASITEGDISVSYKTDGTVLQSNDDLISRLRGKYEARVKFI